MKDMALEKLRKKFQGLTGEIMIVKMIIATLMLLNPLPVLK